MPSNIRQILEPFLSSPDRPEGTLGFHELQGFLFAIACAPQLIMPSEWMPLIFNEEEAGYADMDEAEAVTSGVMALYNDINGQVVERSVTLPRSIRLEKSVLDNVGDQADLGQWSSGFFIGHDWLVELWDDFLSSEPQEDELDEELGSCLMILGLFSSLEMAEAFHDEVLQNDKESLGEFVDRMLTMFEDAMGSYANLGRLIYEVSMEVPQELQQSASEPEVNTNKHVGRNDPCPCRSGKKYKHCCLH